MGQKYAAYNTTNFITGYYDSIDSPLPAGITAIPITDQEWQSCLGKSNLMIVNGAITTYTPSYQELVSQAVSTQSQMLISGYNTAINTPVQFKNSAGVTSSYKFGNTLTAAGTNAQALLTQIIAAGSAAWAAGIWFDVNNVAQNMTYSDLQGLMIAIEAMETPDMMVQE